LARLGGRRLLVRYPGPRRLARALPGFRHLELEALGSFLPPSYAAGAAAGRLVGLARLDAAAARFPGAAWTADHYIAVFERERSRARTGVAPAVRSRA
jgi:hypothetical protein